MSLKLKAKNEKQERGRMERERLSSVNTNQRKMNGTNALIKVLEKHELGGWKIMTCHVHCAIPAASLVTAWLFVPTCLALEQETPIPKFLYSLLQCPPLFYCNGLSRLSNEIVRLHLCCNKLTQDFKLVNQLVLLDLKVTCA